MEPRVLPLGFALGFGGVLALAMAVAVLIGPRAEGAGAAGPATTGLTPYRYAAPARATAAPITATPDAFSTEAAPSFGRLMPDGSYCAIGCPDEDQP